VAIFYFQWRSCFALELSFLVTGGQKES